jgi:tetratricopeptide (TPR) repeat protein
MSKWAIGAFETLAKRLDRMWGRTQFAQQLAKEPTLLTKPQDFVDELQTSLSGTCLLWVIDNAQFLLNDDSIVEEKRFAAIVNAVGSGRWNGCKLLFVTDRELRDAHVRSYELLDGFTPEEARDYLDRSNWPFPELRDAVADALGFHPRALALLLGFARYSFPDHTIHPDEIEQLIDNLRREKGESNLRTEVCKKILDHIMKRLRAQLPEAWWSLLAASTFIESFDFQQFRRVLQALPQDLGAEPRRHLQLLEERSLLHWNRRGWSMHSLIRKYSQDILFGESEAHFRYAHRKAGESYFPLNGKGWLDHGNKNARSRYGNPESCGIALHHFERAEFQEGQNAVLMNAYDRGVQPAKMLIDHGARPNNPTYGFWQAEMKLNQVLKVWALGDEDPVVQAQAASSEINHLMAVALYRQRIREKYDKALVHYKQAAILQGKSEIIPQLISLLCDMAEGQSVDEPHWIEAENLFNQVYYEVDKKPEKSNFYEGLGEAYEKVARRYLFLRTNEQEQPRRIILGQAVSTQLPWDGIYLLAAELEETALRPEKVERWLLRGLELCPRSGELWKRYYLLKAKAGELESVSRRLRFAPRGINTVVSLSQSLIDQGFFEAAKGCVDDALKIEIYENSGTLWFQKAKFQEKLGDVGGAIKSYDQAIKSNASMGEAYVAQGRLHEDLGKVDDAEKVYQRGIEAGVKDTQVFVAYGKLCEVQGNFDMAEQFYTKATTANEASANGWLALSHHYKRRGKLEKAESVCQEAINARVNNTQVFIAWGKLCEDQGNFTKAEEVYIHATTRNSWDPQGWIALGQLYEHRAEEGQSEQIKIEFLKKAVAAHEKAISKSPTFKPAYPRLVRVYLALSDEQEAVIYVKEFEKKAAQDGTCSLILGQFYEDRRMFDKAADLYRGRIKAGVTGGFFYYRMVHLELARCAYDTARGIAEEAMNQPQPDAWSHCALAEAYLKSGNLSQARAICRKGIQDCGSLNRLYELLLETTEQEGNEDEAIAECRNWVDAMPGNGDAHVALASRLLKRGKIDDARQAVQTGKSLVPDWPALLELAKQLKME